MVEENWGVDECQLSLFLSLNLSVIESNLLSHLFCLNLALIKRNLLSSSLSTNGPYDFKFWLIVGNRTQPNEAFCPGPGPLIYIDYSELVSSRPLAVTKIEGERVCWDWGETRRWAITGAFCSHAKAKVSFFFFFFFFIDTLSVFSFCVLFFLIFLDSEI